ncbi:ribonuclease G [Mesosutterella sp. OilRF-GAM-744-9]|uniref:Ribonuclease G n=1 Tax=Mesosutterella porci TaxID=2915351 RepID=A0ABS9MSW8_9BURK|nr:ribonuclease G [Mesosutterella sp. oilRF-744-WT-GAM-9]MCG5031637.1 ribonuclease G [Mesosutterella sp. oilRF-744-WT-GAM-9]MCI6529924.1 ribonuclease G [Mesosutterella sp.]
MEEVLINYSPRETRAAILSDGILEEIHLEREVSRGLVGNVYLGRVVRVLPGMQSAFINIGLERTAFLHVADIEEAHRSDAVLPIERVLHEGDAVMVQVAKDPIGTKGARLTTTVSLAGRKLVYLPKEPHIGVSQRIDDPELRERLREQVAAMRPKDEKGGYIVRTSAEEGVTEEEFRNDMRYLKLLWEKIRYSASHQPAPSLLYQDLSLAQRVLRDMVHAETQAIYVDSQDMYQSLRSFAETFVPAAAGRLRLYRGDASLFEKFKVDEEIEKALRRRVDLKSGGYLVFDQTEAMTTIDVNTGGYVGKKDFGDTVFKTNLEAAQTIARQLRLRNLGGIIIIDFIDMDSDEHREAVLAELRRGIARDRTRMTLSNFTELGLVEMTRKRIRESLAHMVCEPCPVCGGRGEIKTARTVCYEIMREVVREWRQYKDAKEFKILASQSVIDMFLDSESQALELLHEFIGKPVSLLVEPEYTQEQFDVIIA